MADRDRNFHLISPSLDRARPILGLLRRAGTALVLLPAVLALAAVVAAEKDMGTRDVLLLILGGLFLNLGLAVLICRSVARRISEPLARLVQAARHIQEGGYGAVLDMDGLRNSPLEFQIVGMAFNRMSETIKTHIETIERTTVTDQLTGVPNRRFLVSEGPRMLNAALRSGAPFSCLMIDIDHFKQVNDTYGHLVGDRFLVHVARLVAATIRSSDLLARAGGEEFVVLAPNSGREEARSLAERIRQAVADNPLVDQGLRVAHTVSVGLADASLPARFGSNVFEDLLEKADRALYRAKQSGRNRVQAWDGDGEPESRTDSPAGP